MNSPLGDDNVTMNINNNIKAMEKFVNNYKVDERKDINISIYPSESVTCIDPESGVMHVHSFLLEDVNIFMNELIFAVRHEVGHFNWTYKYFVFFKDWLLKSPSSLLEMVVRRLDDIRIDYREAQRDPVLRLWFSKTMGAFLKTFPEQFVTTPWESQVVTILYLMANNAPKEMLWDENIVKFILDNGLLTLARQAREVNHFAQLLAIGEEIVRRMGGDRDVSQNPFDKNSQNSELVEKINQARQQRINDYEKNIVDKINSDSLNQKEKEKAIKQVQKIVNDMRSDDLRKNQNNGISLDEIAKILEKVKKTLGEKGYKEFLKEISKEILEENIDNYNIEHNYVMKVYDLFKSWFKISANKTHGKLNVHRLNRLLSSNPNLFENTRWEKSKCRFDVFALLDHSGSMFDYNKNVITGSIVKHFLQLFQELQKRNGLHGNNSPIRVGVCGFSDRASVIRELSGEMLISNQIEKIKKQYIDLSINHGGGTNILEGVTLAVKAMGTSNDPFVKRLLLVVSDAQVNQQDLVKAFDLCKKRGITMCWICLGVENSFNSPEAQSIYEKYIAPYQVNLDQPKEEIEKKYKNVFYKTLYDAVTKF